MNRMIENIKRLLILMSLLIVVACHSHAQSKVVLPSAWKAIEGCTVSVYAPPDIKFVEDISSDACLREYQSENIALRLYVTPFNIGASDYSNWLEYCVKKTTINGREAEIVTSYIPITFGKNSGLDYSAMLLVPQFRKGSGNLIIHTWSKTLEERNKALKILQSVQLEKN